MTQVGTGGIIRGMKRHLTIEYSDELIAGLGLSPDEFNEQATILLAAKLYEMGRLTSGQAAALCGMGRVEFLLALPRHGVAVSNLRIEDAEDELRFARHG